MSFAEKGSWVATAITVIAYGVYWWIVLARARGAALVDVTYGDVMLGCAIAVIVTSIAAHIVIAALSPRDADKKDQRDLDINRHGDAVSYYILALSVVAVLILTVNGTARFWVANALYAACTLATLVGSTVKFIAYRRGF